MTNKRESLGSYAVALILTLCLAGISGTIGYLLGISYVKTEETEFQLEQFSCDDIYEQARKCVNADHFGG